MRYGTETISQSQQKLLERVSGRSSVSELTESLMRLVRDDDILEGREDVHPEWKNVFENNSATLRRRMSSAVFKHFEEFFDKLAEFDRSLAEINPQSVNISFLLGAGASKPDPSNIPTVKELLPQLLERARRLDRDDVTKLADFCERRKISNIEDLLTAAQLANFCSRNPLVLRLMNYLLYRSDIEEIE